MIIKAPIWIEYRTFKRLQIRLFSSAGDHGKADVMEEFSLVYRSGVVVKPKQPFLDWVQSFDPAYMPTLEDLRRDSHIYLVPDYEDAPDIEKAIAKYLKANYEGIFLNELMSWYTDPQMFPKMTYALFQQWFEVSSHSMIFDTLNQPIDKD